jgi:endonuclease YncB( thermonuclease family)
MALIVLAAATAPVAAQTVSDGDTIKFGAQRVRLFAIDAPEKGQTCDDGAWLPGPLATRALIDFIGGRPVECHQVDYDRKNKRPVSLCFAGGDDLQALMVSAGWAWAYTQFSAQYVDAERRAAARGVGVHAHQCQKPWDWRARNRGDR